MVSRSKYFKERAVAAIRESVVFPEPRIPMSTMDARAEYGVNEGKVWGGGAPAAGADEAVGTWSEAEVVGKRILTVIR